jgi:hypothetical protein
MNAVYYDTVKQWSDFSPYLNHPSFIRAVQQHAWWIKCEDCELKCQMELIYKSLQDSNLTEEEEEEINFFINKAKENGPMHFMIV